MQALFWDYIYIYIYIDLLLRRLIIMKLSGSGQARLPHTYVNRSSQTDPTNVVARAVRSGKPENVYHFFFFGSLEARLGLKIGHRKLP